MDLQPAEKGVIHKLEFNTVSLIKSSQVISSIAAIVKELVENSLDANATLLNIKLVSYFLLNLSEYNCLIFSNIMNYNFEINIFRALSSVYYYFFL